MTPRGQHFGPTSRDARVSVKRVRVQQIVDRGSTEESRDLAVQRWVGPDLDNAMQATQLAMSLPDSDTLSKVIGAAKFDRRLEAIRHNQIERRERDVLAAWQKHGQGHDIASSVAASMSPQLYDRVVIAMSSSVSGSNTVIHAPSTR